MVSTIVRDRSGASPVLVEPDFESCSFKCMLMKISFNAAGEGILTLRIPHAYVESAGLFRGGYGILLDADFARVHD